MLSSQDSLQKSNSKSQANVVTNCQNSAFPTVEANHFLPPIGKWLYFGGCSIFVMLIFAGLSTRFFTYKETVKAPAIVRPMGGVRLVEAFTEGGITKVLVKQGQTVKKGEVIAKIDPNRLQTKKIQLEKSIRQQRLQSNQLNAQISSLESQIAIEAGRNNSEVAAAIAELAGNRRSYEEKNVEANTQVEELEAQLRATEAAFDAAKKKQEKYQFAVTEGAISQAQLAEVELEVKKQQEEMKVVRAKLNRVKATLNPSTAEIEMAQQRIEQVRKSGLASTASLNREREALIQQRIMVERQIEQDLEELSQVNTDLGQTEITATADGTISQLAIRNPGQTVQPGQEIAQIVPSNGSIEVKAMVSTKDISKLETNQRVQMRISACPYPDYGVLEGTVKQIAKDTSKPQNNNTNSYNSADKSTPVFYEVAIAPVDSAFGRGKDVCSLHLGMEGSADIITKEETVLKFLLRKARLTTNL